MVGIIQGSAEIQAYNQSYQGVVDGLMEAGYHDNFSLRLQRRIVDNQPERAFQAARELVKDGAQVLVCLGTIPTLAALKATDGQDIPIVYTIVGAPEATGLGRPPLAKDVRFTGTSMEVPPLEQLQMLRQAIPGIKRIGIVYCPQTPQATATGQEMAAAAGSLGLEAIVLTLPQDKLADLPTSLAPLWDQRIEALIIPTDPILALPKYLEIICRAAEAAWVPVQVVSDSMVPFGALLAYHCDFYDIGRQAGRQTGKILAGVPPGKVPPEQPRLRKLTVNLKMARRLGLELHRPFLSLASHLVQ